MRKYDRVEPLGDLVSLPFVATLATYRKDGSVLLSPVWHEWHDGGFNVTLAPDDVKARHVRNDPRASIVLYENDPPYRGVELSGTPRLVEEDALVIQKRIAKRYLGEEAGEAYGSDPNDSVVTLRLEPGVVRAWDFAEEF